MATYTIGPFTCTGTDTSTGMHEFAGRVILNETVNSEQNTSTIAWRAELYIIRSAYVSNLVATSNNNFSIKIQNAAKTDTYLDFSSANVCEVRMNGHYSSNPLVLKSGTITNPIAHENDGSKTLYVEMRYYKNLAYMLEVAGNGTVALTNIPRASAVTSVTNVNIGEAPVVKWTPATNTYTYKITYSCGGWSHEYENLISPATTSECTFNAYSIPSEVATKITNSKTGTGTCKIETFSDVGGTKSLGSATKTFTITVPPSFGPTAAFKSITAVNSFGDYNLANMTSFNYDCTSSTAQSDAEIVAYVVTVRNSLNSVIYTGNSSTGSVGAVSTSGSLSFTLTVTDSRGYTNTSSPVVKTITAYSKPSVTSAFITRGIGTVTDVTTCNDFREDEGGGNVARITYSTSFTNLNNNTLYVSVLYGFDGSNVVQTGLSGGTNNVVYFKPAGGGFDPDESYTFVISVYDTISGSSNPETMTVSLSAAWFPMDFLPDGSGAAFGKVASDDYGSGLLDSAWNINSDGIISATGASASSELSSTSLTFKNSSNNVTGKFTSACYGVMMATCSGSDIGSAGDLHVRRDLFQLDVKAVIAVIPTSSMEPVYFTITDSTPSTYEIEVKRIDGGSISSSAGFCVLALPN